jgi:acetyl-CoA acetyltransferase
MADCIIAGGTESMSYIPMGGYKPVPETDIAKQTLIIIGEWVTRLKK